MTRIVLFSRFQLQKSKEAVPNARISLVLETAFSITILVLSGSCVTGIQRRHIQIISKQDLPPVSFNGLIIVDYRSICNLHSFIRTLLLRSFKWTLPPCFRFGSGHADNNAPFLLTPFSCFVRLFFSIIFLFCPPFFRNCFSAPPNKYLYCTRFAHFRLLLFPPSSRGCF